MLGKKSMKCGEFVMLSSMWQLKVEGKQKTNRETSPRHIFEQKVL